MKEKITTSKVLGENFADDTELQIIELLQTKDGREVLKKAIDQIRKERRKLNDQN